jgi:uncharacterized membrane protein YqaE (UPF0057 family)
MNRAGKRTAHFAGFSVMSVAAKGYDSPMPVTALDPVKVIAAILLPPLGVFLEVGVKGHFWLNILLTLLGFIPGVIHALYVIVKK